MTIGDVENPRSGRLILNFSVRSTFQICFPVVMLTANKPPVALSNAPINSVLPSPKAVSRWFPKIVIPEKPSPIGLLHT